MSYKGLFPTLFTVLYTNGLLDTKCFGAYTNKRTAAHHYRASCEAVAKYFTTYGTESGEDPEFVAVFKSYIDMLYMEIIIPLRNIDEASAVERVSDKQLLQTIMKGQEKIRSAMREEPLIHRKYKAILVDIEDAMRK